MAVYLIAETKPDDDQEPMPAYSKALGAALMTFGLKVLAAGAGGRLVYHRLTANEFESTGIIRA